jgi:hypothetical protein
LVILGNISAVVTTNTAVNTTAESEYVCGGTTVREKYVPVQGSGFDCLKVLLLLSSVNDVML